MTGSGSKTFVVGLVGVIVGLVLSAALRPDRDPPRRSTGRTAALETNLARIERGLERLLERMDQFQQRGGAPQTEKAASKKRSGATDGLESVRERPSGPAGRLFELARRPMEEQKLRALDAARRPDEDVFDQVLLKQFAFRTYREILEDFGRPTEVSVDQHGTSFEYVFTDREGGRRGISFEFVDGFVYSVSTYQTSR